MRRRLATAAALLATSAPGPSWAQGGHGHAHTGQEQKIGRYEVELVVRGADATLLVRDEGDRPVDAAAFGATAVALARGNERRTLDFRPAGDNRLVGIAKLTGLGLSFAERRHGSILTRPSGRGSPAAKPGRP